MKARVSTPLSDMDDGSTYVVGGCQPLRSDEREEGCGDQSGAHDASRGKGEAGIGLVSGGSISRGTRQCGMRRTSVVVCLCDGPVVE
jgi:hypothetical protein